MAALAGAAAVWACGGGFDDDLGPPSMAESSWLARLLKSETTSQKLPPVVLKRRSAATDATGKVLEDALGNHPEKVGILAAWHAFREALTFEERREDERYDRYGYDQDHPLKPPPSLAWPSGLPPAFALYEEGALAWRHGKPELARSCWRKVLELPEDQRCWRAANAAYMLGRSSLETPETCAKYMTQCRTLAAAGAPDPEGLAAASWGWEARAWLDAKNYEKAITLYFTQAACGDAGAMTSLSASVSRLFQENSAVLMRVVKDDQARKIVSAVILNRNERSRWDWGCPPQEESASTPSTAWRWLDALDAAGKTAKEDAVALAWFAYQAGAYERAARLAQDSPLPMAAWIRAKMALRAGDQKLACLELEKAIAGFAAQPKAESGPMVADNGKELAKGAKSDLHAIWHGYGQNSLATGDYAQALTWFHEAGSSHSADYVAERVMTCDELKAWVDARPGVMSTMLAIRLARAGRLAEARPYCNPQISESDGYYHAIGAQEHIFKPNQPEFDDYFTSIQTAQNNTLPKLQRADAWWRAAELAPPFYGCLLTLSWAETSNPPTSPDPVLDARKKEGAPPDELARLANTKPATAYRYLALDHAFAACALMDDNTDALALRLWTAGKWVAARDPKAADRFYKALVTRCGKTAFGRDADARRWFPPNPPGEAQPPIRRLPPTQAQVWKARIKARPWLLLGGFAAVFSALLTGAWLWRKKCRRQ